MSDFKAQVEAGIKALDAHYGNSSWRDRINLDDLDLGSCSVCVLGQLFGDYDTGLEEMDLPEGDSYSHGFNARQNMPELTQAWKDALGKNNVLVEVGDLYKDSYGYAAKVVQTSVVKLHDGTFVTAYIVESGTIDSSDRFKPYKDNSGKPELNLFTKQNFEAGGTYPTKVKKFQPKAGQFVETSDGRKWFVYSSNEVRELKDGEWAVNARNVDWTGAKVMRTGPGVTFGESIKNALENSDI